MTWRELSVEQFTKLNNALIVDVRSPGEHEAERIPGSVNVPLLTDEERAVVGTIYKQQGEMIARRHALTILSPKIPSYVDQIVAQRTHGQTVVVYCWRGGLRSESVSSVLSMAGVDCFRLTGGYKAWRTKVVADFEQDVYPFKGVVLVGLTGTGKTEILVALAQQGVQTLDLEAMANHRGSTFGALGLGQQPSQKNFDARLWEALRSLKPAPVLLEGESRKIGRVSLPDCVLKRIVEGPYILVTGSLERRAQRISSDYLAPQRNPEAELSKALVLLENLRPRLGAKKVGELQALLSAGNVHEAVKILLVDYYDPLYNHQIDRCFPFLMEVDGDDPRIAAEKIAAWVQSNASALAPTL